MTTLRLTAALAVGIIAWTASPALAQDKGKTAAATLSSESQAALQNLYAGVPLAKELGKTAAGMGKSTTTQTLKSDVYAFVFSQKGLMAGLGIQGNKITKITPK